MKKFYFEDEDANVCMPLEHFLDNAKSEGLKEITLIEAIESSEDYYCWCKLNSSVVCNDDCNKLGCFFYEPDKDDCKKCRHKGVLREFGNKVVFDVESGKVIENK